jgi:hypothetical protein
MSTFKVGDRVRIAEGTHANRTGTVITMPWGALALRVDAEDAQATRGGRGGFVCDVDKYNLVLL